jgi:hypothetical protein
MKMKKLISALIISTFAVSAPAVDYSDPLVEAQLIALELSGDLTPPPNLTQQVLEDLAAIRAAYPQLADIRYRRRFSANQIIVGITPEAAEKFRNIQYHALDDLNQTYGVIEIDAKLNSLYPHLLLKFNQIYNMPLLAQIYTDANLEGVRYIEPNYRIGDGPTIIAEPNSYMFIDAWGDCPSGCIYHEYWKFNIESGRVILCNTFYVDAVNGNDRNLGYTPETAFNTIQHAIDTVREGSTIILLPGTYTGPGNRDIDFRGKAITVRSQNGPENCIIDCNGTYEDPHRGFYFRNGEDANSILDGFTITNGFVFRHGGGLFCEDASPLIKNCILTANSGLFGVGGGISCLYSNLRLINCILSRNSASYVGGGMYSYASCATITNCTFTGNSVRGWQGGGLVCDGGRTTITNSIFWANTAADGNEIALENSIIDINYCNILGGRSEIYKDSSSTINWGMGNIEIDPCFANPDVNDYHLLLDSPCINSGDPNYIPEPNETDLDGLPRIIGGRIDIGAYEYNHQPIAIAGPNKTAYAFINGLADVTLDGSASYDDDNYILDYYWSWIIDSNLFEANGVSPVIQLPVGQHQIELIVDDGIDLSEPDYCTITVVGPLRTKLWLWPAALNCNSGQQNVTAMMFLPSDIYPHDLNDKPLIMYPCCIQSEYQRVFRMNDGRCGRTIVMAAFDKDQLCDCLDAGLHNIEVTGRLHSGRYFYGTNMLRITRPNSHRWPFRRFYPWQ